MRLTTSELRAWHPPAYEQFILGYREFGFFRDSVPYYALMYVSGGRVSYEVFRLRCS